jgi:hypothetical protein
MIKKEKKTKKKLSIVNLSIIIIIFVIIFGLALGSILKIINKKSITNYNGIDFQKKFSNGTYYYIATFNDTYGKEFQTIFYNNPINLEDVKVNGKIELKNNTIIFTDPIDTCENFYDNAVLLPVVLFKIVKTNPEVRSIQGINFSNYSLSTDTFIYVKQVGKLEQPRIEKIDAGYTIYVRNCEIEKSFERFMLATYLNKQNINLTNQRYY